MAKPKPIASRDAPVNEIVGVLERMHNRYGPWEVFRKFLDLCHVCLDELPDNIDRAIKHEPFVESEAYKKAVAGLDRRDIESFARCFGVLINATESGGSLTYRDVIGTAYMVIGQGNKWAGQYFTPQTVADCMAAMVMGDMADLEKEFYKRLAAASEDDPILKCLGLTATLASGCDGLKGAGQDWMLTKFLPAAMLKIEPFKICDPCVGSGVLLLSAAKACPRWLIDIGFVKFYGIDIDQTCVSMCRLNMRLYGIEKMRWPESLIRMYEAGDKAIVPPPLDSMYENVREARHSRDSKQEAAAMELISQARQGNLFA